MATLLLIVIYIAYIGLGVPDSLFGAAWPAIYTDFAVPDSFAGIVTVLTSSFSLISSLFSARIINRFGTDKVTAVSTTLTAVALFGISFSGNFGFLLLLSIPLGLGAGAIDSALNTYVALHYSAMQLNFLHCFYGVGVSISPYLLSLALGDSGSWRGGYRIIALVQLVIAASTIFALPLWKKVHKDADSADSDKQTTLSTKEILKIKGLPAIWLMFIASCAIEAICTAWGSTFLVMHKGMAVDKAALAVTFYFFGIALGRFVSGLISTKLSTELTMGLGLLLLIPAVILLALPLNNIASLALLLTGLGVSPIYPNLMHLTPKLFGRSVAQSVMGTNMAAAYVSILFTPPLFGAMAKGLSYAILPYCLAILTILLILPLLWILKIKK